MEKPNTSSSTDHNDQNLCSICSMSTSEKLVNVTAKGKETLKKTSIERRDNLFNTLTDSDTVWVHHSCRSNYIHKISVSASKRRQSTLTVSPVKRKLRRSSSCSSIEIENVRQLQMKRRRSRKRRRKMAVEIN